MKDLVIRGAGNLAAVNPAALPWRDVVEAFFDARRGDFSPHTERAYRRHIRFFFRTTGRATFGELTGRDLATFRAALFPEDQTEKRRSLAREAQALAALRSVLGWARKAHVGACLLSTETIGDVLRIPRVSGEPFYDVLDDEEIGKVLGACRTARDRAILAVMLGGGLRVGELVALDVADVHLAAGQIEVRAGKGRKDRPVPVAKGVLQSVLDYLAETGRTLEDRGPLFRAHDRGAARRDRKRLTARAVGDVVAGAVKRAGIDTGRHLSPHAMRTTFATRYLRATGNLLYLQRLLGHASPETTKRYLRRITIDEIGRTVLPLPEATHAA